MVVVFDSLPTGIIYNKVDQVRLADRDLFFNNVSPEAMSKVEKIVPSVQAVYSKINPSLCLDI